MARSRNRDAVTAERRWKRRGRQGRRLSGAPLALVPRCPLGRLAGQGRRPGSEVDLDTTAYEQAHIPGALGWNWETELQDQVRRTLADRRQFEALCSRSGIAPDTTVIVYGDNNNWFAAWALWQFKIYGHKDVRLMNGDRKK